MKCYMIKWKHDNSEEIYETSGERSGRLLTLKDQGYERNIDFEIYTLYD